MTIDSTIFPSPYEYVATQAADIQTLDTLKVASDETLATCPAIVFDLINQDLSAFDTQVFTLSATTGSQTLTTETSLEAKIGTYTLRLLAQYEGV